MDQNTEVVLDVLFNKLIKDLNNACIHPENTIMASILLIAGCARIPEDRLQGFVGEIAGVLNKHCKCDCGNCKTGNDTVH